MIFILAAFFILLPFYNYVFAANLHAAFFDCSLFTFTPSSLTQSCESLTKASDYDTVGGMGKFQIFGMASNAEYLILKYLLNYYLKRSTTSLEGEHSEQTMPLIMSTNLLEHCHRGASINYVDKICQFLTPSPSCWQTQAYGAPPPRIYVGIFRFFQNVKIFIYINIITQKFRNSQRFIMNALTFYLYYLELD